MGKEKRKSNIELLRIIAMITIVASHYTIHGVQQWTYGDAAYQVWLNGSSAAKIITSLFVPGGVVGVAVFFMIAGYFSVNKKSVLPVKVILKILYYAVITLILFVICNLIFGPTGESVESTLYNIFKVIFNPVSSGVYWFVTIYLMLMLIAPKVNGLLYSLNPKGRILLLVGVWLFWYVCAEFGQSEFYVITKGLFFYLLGATIKLSGFTLPIGCSAAAFVVSWGGAAAITYIVTKITNNESRGIALKLMARLMSSFYLDILVPIASVSLLLLFLKINIGASETINRIASGTLGVYLIHDSCLLRKYIWDDIFHVATYQYMSKYMIVWAGVSIASIYLVCTLIDMLRMRFAEPWYSKVVSQGLRWIKSNYLQ